ncbi:MAG: hypothetical protein WC679_01570 [Bacteroidales bacterium]|jgi:hypothetical protein
MEITHLAIDSKFMINGKSYTLVSVIGDGCNIIDSNNKRMLSQNFYPDGHIVEIGYLNHLVEKYARNI